MTAVAGAVTSSHERRERRRRVKRLSLRYPERRAGFDRRDSSRHQLAMDGFRSNAPAMAGVLGLILLLNAMDLILTLQAFRLGATEANPVMAWLFDQDLMLASFFKLGLGTAVAITIWRLRRYRRVLELSLVLAGVFILVVGYHLAGRIFVS